MKTENEIKRQLEEIYNYRLSLRVDRKTKKTCRNCKYGRKQEINLGQFGQEEIWQCSQLDKKCNFDCKYTEKDIEEEMLKDISNPSVCGAKEPKIAALLWVLHDDKKGDKSSTKQEEPEEKSKSFWQRLWGK